VLFHSLQAKGSDGSGYDGEDTGDGDTEDGTDNGGSSRRQKSGAKRARLGGPSNSNPETAGASGQGRGSGGGNNSDPGAAGLAGAAGYAGLDLLQAYQPQYWDAAQNEVSGSLAARVQVYGCSFACGILSWLGCRGAHLSGLCL
jgi:hypothetical protein